MGLPLTEEDNDLARRRYEEYLRLSKEHEGVVFEDILPFLPLDGGTPLPCGCTRFEHLQTERCRNPKFDKGARCSMLTPRGFVCGKRAGHSGAHKSAYAVQQQRLRQQRERKNRKVG